MLFAGVPTDVIDNLRLRLFLRLSTRNGLRIKENGVFGFRLNMPIGVFMLGVFNGDVWNIPLRPIEECFCRLSFLPIGVENANRLCISCFIGVFSLSEVTGVADSLMIFLLVFEAFNTDFDTIFSFFLYAFFIFYAAIVFSIIYIPAKTYIISYLEGWAAGSALNPASAVSPSCHKSCQM